jgi:hypothetical protein
MEITSGWAGNVSKEGSLSARGRGEESSRFAADGHAALGKENGSETGLAWVCRRSASLRHATQRQQRGRSTEQPRRHPGSDDLIDHRGAAKLAVLQSA